MSPTERSLAYLRKQGYTCAVVEKWNPHAKLRQDLFGFIDILAIRRGETLGVQATSLSNVSSRVNKITEASDVMQPTADEIYELTPVICDTEPAKKKRTPPQPRVREVRMANWRIEVHGWGVDSKGKLKHRIEDLS